MSRTSYKDRRQWRRETIIVDLQRYQSDPDFRAQTMKEARAAAQVSPPRRVKVVGKETKGARKIKLFEIWNHMNADGTSPYDYPSHSMLTPDKPTDMPKPANPTDTPAPCDSAQPAPDEPF